MKLLKCLHCQNSAEVIDDHKVPLMCCGEKMFEYKAGETEGAGEKHIPVVQVEGNKVTVKVGEVTHPMTEEHYIGVIWLVTDKTTHRAALSHTGTPEAVFALADGEKPLEAYEFCNLHGLWKTTI